MCYDNPTDLAALFLHTMPDGPPHNHDAQRLAELLTRFALAGYQAAMEDSVAIYYQQHVNNCVLMKGIICRCFSCRVAAQLAAMNPIA
jgi:hypothetical protein